MIEFLDKFRDTGALLDGHFILSSGLHSSRYLQCALALQNPDDAARFGREIADRVRTGSGSDWVHPMDIDTVASPAIGGLVIGFATAQSLNKRFIWTERENGMMTLRRGFSIQPGEQVLVVEDVITTGGSTRECIAELESRGAKVVAAASIVDRSNGSAEVGVSRISVVSLDVPSYAPDVCPMCALGTEAIKPGSRTTAK